MKQDETNPKLISRLGELKSVPARNPQMAARGRSRFLTEASHIRETASLRKNQRLNGWNLIFRKEMPMKTILSALIVFALFASTTTVFAAQNDLPNQPLYGIKTLSEDTSLLLTTDPAAKLERLMQLAQVRVQEMTALVEQGQAVPEQVIERLRQHIETALQLAASQNDQDMQTSLLQIQTQLQTQEQVMTQLQTSASGVDQPILEQARVMTQEQLRLADQGLEDPLTFRNRNRFQGNFAIGTPIPTLTGIPSETLTPGAPGYGPGPNAQPTPGAGNPTPGTGNGPGPNPTPGGSGNGNGGGNGSGGGGRKP